VTDTPDAPTEMPELPGVTHAFVTLSTGLRMHVAEAGNPDATTVLLLLHGFPQHWWEWRKVIPAARRALSSGRARPARRWLDGRTA
jgi:pimeloyl-ACP methyl ester carboxylesterase